MDDLTPRAEVDGKHVMDRAHELFLERWNKGFRVTANRLSVILTLEGYVYIAPRVLRACMDQWIEKITVKTDQADPTQAKDLLELAAHNSELLAMSRISLAERDIEAIHRGMSVNLDAAEAISEEICKRLPSIKIDSPADLASLVDTMAKLAETAARMRRAASDIIRHQADALDEDGNAVDGTIIPPNRAQPPAQVFSALADFERYAGIKR